MFFNYFLSKNPLQYLNTDIQPILRGDCRNPPQHILQMWMNCELDKVDTCEYSHKRVTLFLPEVEPTAHHPPACSNLLHSPSTSFWWADLILGSNPNAEVRKNKNKTHQSFFVSQDCILLNFHSYFFTPLSHYFDYFTQQITLSISIDDSLYGVTSFFFLKAGVLAGLKP